MQPQDGPSLSVVIPAYNEEASIEKCITTLETALRDITADFEIVVVGIHVLAATTYLHWPIEFHNPLVEVTLRLLREGYAPHSLGTLIGLRGVWSLVPLYGAVVVLVVLLLTPGTSANVTWQFVTRTYEP